MDDLIGFSGPNDFVTFVLRAKLSRQFGIFGRVTMWGGVKLHEFYPPLATLVVRLFGMGASILLYLLITSISWTIGRGPVIAAFFLLSFFHLIPLLYVGRFAELFGYTLLASCIFANNSVISGALFGLAALSHPTSLIFGLLTLTFRLDPLLHLVAFTIYGWWYVPFVLKRRELFFLKEERSDKVFGIYLLSYASIANLALFLFTPPWISFLGTLLWLSPIFIWLSSPILEGHLKPRQFSIRRIFNRLSVFYKFLRQPFFVSDVLKELPKLQEIKDKCVLIKEKEIVGSRELWIWACACYLLDKGIIVYNGIPSTEVSIQNLNVPSNLQVLTIEELK